jgi:hypothetical protein
MKVITLTLCMGLSASLSYLYRPGYANAQALCFWSDSQGELRDLSSVCETNSDKKVNNQSEMKAIPGNSPATGNQQEVKPTVQGQQPDRNLGGTWKGFDFIPDGSPPIVVVGNEEKRGPDGTIFRGDGMITTPDGLSVQMIVKNGKIVGNQYYRADGTKLMPGESITSPNGIVLRQQKF